ncbi:hypothetical protein ACCO45_000608 [Purpureocillium lilacinum]|uniref:Uncharacterized protein n=1 Tax=Purpureocillium lilacinum TaxID=33203 RepID=A0ACC4E4P2_PURLI
MLLDHYIQRFSRTYPAFSGPTNPFLRVILPLSMQSRVVLDSLLALGGVQSWDNGGFALEGAMLKLRQKALRGCHELAGRMRTGRTRLEDSDDLTLAGALRPEQSATHAFQFVTNLFLYNDLVRSTSLRTSTFSDFYLADGHIDPAGVDDLGGLDSNDSKGDQDLRRFVFPRLITRITAGDITVTDQEIADWDGALGWLPSFSLAPPLELDPYEHIPTANRDIVTDPRYRHLDSFTCPREWSEQRITSELYRIAGTVYRKQCVGRVGGLSSACAWPHDAWMGNLPLWAVQLIDLLPPTSAFQNTLLWPIGIIAKELTVLHDTERASITRTLNALEKRFQMRHFARARQHLQTHWAMCDQGYAYNDGEILCG